MPLEPDEVPLCPYCDMPIDLGNYVVAVAHGCYFLAHEDCHEEELVSLGEERSGEVEP